MRNLIKFIVLMGGVTSALPAFAQSFDRAHTTRIETRPYYGATVTIEQGVRVFRGLPPTRHMIINPHGQTPLHVGIHDTRILEKSESHNHFYDHSSKAVPVRGGVVGTPAFVGGKFARHGKRFKGRPGRVFSHPRAAPHKKHGHH